jgi:hypothetical protein
MLLKTLVLIILICSIFWHLACSLLRKREVLAMLRFMPFYTCFLTMLCAPVEFARAQAAPEAPAAAEATAATTGQVVEFMGEREEAELIRHCLRISEVRRSEIRSRPSAEEPSVQDRVDFIEAGRNGLLNRECAQHWNGIFGVVETGVGAYYGVRATRGLLRRRNHYMNDEAWQRSRRTQSITYNNIRLEDGIRRLRVPGITPQESEMVRNAFMERSRPLRTQRFTMGGLRSPLATVQEADQRAFPLGRIIEVEVNNTRVVTITGSNGQPLPDYVVEAIRNLSSADVDALNGNSPRYEVWRHAATPVPLTPASRFLRGVADAMKEGTVGIDGRVQNDPILQEAYLAGRNFVTNPQAFRILLEHGVERVAVDTTNRDPTEIPRALQAALETRRITGNIGPGRVHYRTLTNVGIGLLFAHGLNNLFVTLSNYNDTNSEPVRDYSGQPYLRDHQGWLRRNAGRISPAGIAEIGHSALGLRSDQGEPAPTVEPAR